MLFPLALAAALAAGQPAPAGKLTISNLRNTFGEFGGPRPDAKLAPGDLLFVGFDIEGLTVNPRGQVTYTMALKVTDAAGKVLLSPEPAEKLDFVPLGGGRLPARAYVNVTLDQPAGRYTLAVTVTDKSTGAAQTVTKTFEVGPPEFAVVGVYTSIDERGQVAAPTTGVLGQSVFVHFMVVGFDRAAAAGGAKQPNVTVEVNFLDETGRPTAPQPMRFELAGGIREEDPSFTLRFLVPLTRPGRYTVRIAATDGVAKKAAKYDLPLTVIPPG